MYIIIKSWTVWIKNEKEIEQSFPKRLFAHIYHWVLYLQVYNGIVDKNAILHTCTHQSCIGTQSNQKIPTFDILQNTLPKLKTAIARGFPYLNLTSIIYIRI